MKKILIVGLVVVFTLTLTSVSFAGGRYYGGPRGRHHNGSGALILGGVVLGLLGLGALISARQQPVVAYPPPPPPEYVPGHWESIREWVPGTWERVWVPNYYDSWRKRVAGHYEDRQTPGYYVERRVWIEGH